LSHFWSFEKHTDGCIRLASYNFLIVVCVDLNAWVEWFLRYRVSKSTDTKGDFEHVWSFEQHADGISQLTRYDFSYHLFLFCDPCVL